MLYFYRIPHTQRVTSMGEIILKRIRLRRAELGYSQEYMGYQLNISQFAYHKIERGKTKLNIGMLVNICNVLELDPKKLFEIN